MKKGSIELKKILIYGLGEGRIYIEKCIKPSHKVIGYTDSVSIIKVFNGRKFYRLDEIQESSFDYIILAMENKKTCTAIIEMLSGKYKIDRDKILDFWHIYYATCSVNLADYRVLKNNNILDGVILGLSHGEAGINIDYLTGNWCNLAISSSDIFSNYKVFEYVYGKYQKKFNDLKYVIIDLFDWLYFNYDTSMARNALNCIGSIKNIPGIFHNLKNNKKIIGEEYILDEVLKLKGFRPLNEFVTEKELLQIDELFNDIHAQEWVYKKYNKIKRYGIIDENCDDYLKPDYMPAIAKKHFRGTKQENILVLRKLLDMLYQINGNMKIYGVLIPRYYTVENVHREIYREWKEEFQDIIADIRKDYKFELLNFKDYLPISANHNFYFDVSHLNEIGSIAFTSLLDSIIFEK